jgi:hypothetical protein
MKAQFKDQKFGTDRAFRVWLEHHWYYMITFYDHKQDLSVMWIHKSGEILHSDFSQAVYAGKFVDTNLIKRDQPLRIFNPNTLQYDTYKGLVIEAVDLNHKNL